VANYFEEQVSQVLESLNQDPEGMYQIVYRVGELMVSPMSGANRRSRN
jgi:hypothetical protein